MDFTSARISDVVGYSVHSFLALVEQKFTVFPL